MTQSVFAMAGLLGGAILADRARLRDVRWPLLLSLITLLAAAVPAMLLYLTPGVELAYGMAAILALLFSVSSGPVMAHLQNVVNPEQRAMAVATSAMIASFLGLGLGTTAIGGLSDLYAAALGSRSLGFALLTVTLAAIFWAAIHLIVLLRSLEPEAIPDGIGSREMRCETEP